MSKRLFAVAMAAPGLLASSLALAAACSGPSPFPDVDPTSSFCSNVEWMKNRGITAGCPPGGFYCPNDPVTRGQMAAFMNRLADKVVPPPIVTSANPGALDLTLLGMANVACPTIVPAVAYPRTFIVSSFVNFIMGSGVGAIGTTYIYTTDGDTTHWNATFGYGPIVSPDSTHWATATFTNAIDIPAGATAKVGIWVFRADSSASAAVAQSYCNLVVQPQSRTGAASPY